MEEKELAEELEEIGKILSIHTDEEIVELIRSSRRRDNELPFRRIIHSEHHKE